MKDNTGDIGNKAFGRKEGGGKPGKDSMAHPSHHEMNKKHGGGGFNAPEKYEPGEESENEECD